MKKERFEVSYSEPNIEKEIPGWAGKTIKSTKVEHMDSDLPVRCTQPGGTVKKYYYNGLTFWTEDP